MGGLHDDFDAVRNNAVGFRSFCSKEGKGADDMVRKVPCSPELNAIESARALRDPGQPNEQPDAKKNEPSQDAAGTMLVTEQALPPTSWHRTRHRPSGLRRSHDRSTNTLAYTPSASRIAELQFHTLKINICLHSLRVGRTTSLRRHSVQRQLTPLHLLHFHTSNKK